jgi:hypothetical protein
MWNAGQVWTGLSIPGAGAGPTLATDGTPDATANPNAKHIGMTDKGTKCTYSFTKKDAMDDEHTGPHATRIVQEVMTIEGAWKQVLDAALLAKISVGGNNASITGGNVVQFGGKQQPTADCIAVIAPRSDNAAKFVCFMLYSCYNESGVQLSNTKEDETSSPFKFTALAVQSRAVGDQLGQMLIQS